MLISYHYPPGQAAGALRWQKLAPYVADAGWALDVVTADPETVEGGADWSRIPALATGTRLFAVPTQRFAIERLEHLAWLAYRRLRPRRLPAPRAPARNDPAPAPAGGGSRSRAESVRWTWTPADLHRTYYSLLQFGRDRAWAARALAVGRALARRQRYDAVITCGPPHLVHEAGRRIAESAAVPFVMDLRDPWAHVERVPNPLASPVWFVLADRYERRCVSHATLVIMNTDRARDVMRAAYPAHAARIVTVMNGWDDEPCPAPTGDHTFTVAFAGSISLDRDPSTLLEPTATVVRRHQLAPGDFQVVFVGELGAESDPAGPAAIAEQLGIRQHVRVLGFRPRAEVTVLLSEAEVLVSLYQDSTLAVPSKIYEYLAYPSRILAFAEPDSATAAVLAGLDADVVAPRDVEGVVGALERRYRAFQARIAPLEPLRPSHLSRAASARVLIEHLERLSASTRAQRWWAPAPATLPS